MSVDLSNDNNSEETQLLQDEEHPSDDEEDKGADFMSLLSRMNDNMIAMSESMKRMCQGTSEAETAAKKARKSPEPGDSAVNDLLNDGRNADSNEAANLESEDSLLDEIVQSLSEGERTAEAVPEKLAKVANTSWLHKLNDEQLKEKSSKYNRASNCTKMVVPKVNEEIWGKLPRSARGKDVKYQHLQTNTTKVGHIVVKMTEAVMGLKKKAEPGIEKELNELMIMSTDAIALLGDCGFEISQLRREDIKPNLHKDYGDLCSANVPVTEHLFGDELQTQLSHIRAANKIGNTASSQRRNYRNNDSRQQGKHFLFRASPTHYNRGYKQRRHNNNNNSYPRTKSAESHTKK